MSNRFLQQQLAELSKRLELVGQDTSHITPEYVAEQLDELFRKLGPPRADEMAEFDEMLERSSLGSPVAKAIRRMSTPHEVTDECVDVHCWEHDVDERADESSYRRCGECLHVFQTEQELVDKYNENSRAMHLARPDWGPPLPVRTSGDSIYHCPYCIHDF